MGAVMPSRVTKAITYSLKDRGYKIAGKDRSNVDVSAMVAMMNSPLVQEIIANGTMYGYYGHEIRQRFGMIPPETAKLEGRLVRLEPACRTVELSATKDGTVTHKQEFLENDAGEHAYQNYKGRVGGFSIASNYKPTVNGMLAPSQFGGFDYTRQPNFAANTSYGLFDSAFIADDELNASIAAAITPYLDREIVAIYDSIARESELNNHLNMSLDRVVELEKQNQRLRQQAAAKLRRQKEVQIAMYDNAICPTVPFDEAVERANSFLSKQISDKYDLGKNSEEKEPTLFGRTLGKLFGGA
jgi:hypothetical protein